MNQFEWNSCQNPLIMLEYLRGKISNRKILLFGIACCRRICPTMDEHDGRILDLLEEELEGNGKRKQESATRNTILHRAAEFDNLAWAILLLTFSRTRGQGILPCLEGVWAAVTSLSGFGAGYPHDQNAWHDAHAAFAIARMEDQSRDSWNNLLRAVGNLHNLQPEVIANFAAMANLLFDIAGDPFVRIAFESKWRNPTTISLGQMIYETGDFERMPILADALQEAGCHCPAIIKHCQSPGIHVRGCWVLDGLLDKA